MKVKVPVTFKSTGFWIPGIVNENLVPPAGTVAVLNPLLIVISLLVVSITQVGVVGKFVKPPH